MMSASLIIYIHKSNENQKKHTTLKLCVSVYTHTAFMVQVYLLCTQ